MTVLKKYNFKFTITSFFKGVIVFFVLMCGFAKSISSQNISDSLVANRLNEVVITTGQINENSLSNSVLKVKVIDNKRIQSQGAFNLQTLLCNELNVRINQDPLLGSSLILQGVSGQNIKILLDGVPVIGRENGNIDLTQINLNNVDRIEMIEGPMSVNFGSDALGGVINIISKKPTKNNSKVSASLYAETIGQYNSNFEYSTAGKRIAFQILGGRNIFFGYPQTEESRVKIWKPRLQYFSNINFGLNIKNGSLKLNTLFFDEKISNKGEAIVNSYEAYAKDEYYFTRRINSTVFFEKKYNSFYSVHAIVSYQNYRRIRNSFQKDLLTLKEELIQDAQLQDSNYFSLWMSRGTVSKKNKNDKFNYQLGYEFNNETAIGNRLALQSVQITDYNLFASTEWKPVEKILIRPAMRFIYNTQFAAPLIPSIHFKYDLQNNIAVRFSYARGFRAPSLKELHLQFVDPNHNLLGNPKLQAETSDNIQFALNYENKSNKSTLVIEPSLFLNHIKNRIDFARLQSSIFVAQYINIGEFKSVGFNLDVEYRREKFSTSFGYAYTSISNSVLNKNTNERYFDNSQFRANAMYNFSKLDANINLFFKVNGKLNTYQYDIVNDNYFSSYINTFALFDFTLTKNMLNKKMSLTFGCKNIFDVQNVQASFISGPHSNQNNSALIALGRSLFVSYKINLDWNKK